MSSETVEIAVDDTIQISSGDQTVDSLFIGSASNVTLDARWPLVR